MKLKLKLRYKIQLIVIAVSVLIFMAAIGYISFKAKETAYDNTIRLIEVQAEKSGLQIQDDINAKFAVVRTLANAFKSYDMLPKDDWQELVNQMYEYVFKANPSFYQIWDSWELVHVDSTWEKSTGRISNNWYRENDLIKSTSDLRSLDGDSELYAQDKERKEELVVDIYEDVYSSGKQEKKLMTTLETPILKDNKYIGLVGLDLPLDELQEIVKDVEIRGMEKTTTFLISHNFIYAGHPDDDLINKEIEQNPTNQEDFDLYEKMESGESFNLIHNKADTAERFVAYAPIKMGNAKEIWYLGVSVPVESIMAQANENFNISLLVGLIGLIILSLVIYFVARNITIPIESVTTRLNNLAKGQIDNSMKLAIHTGDEIEEMANALNTSIEELNRKNEFAQKLGEGELDHQFELTNEEDQLGLSLIEMRDNLKKAREEEEKRKIEDQKRRWVNEGLAKFADILRQNNDNLDELSYSIISNLVKYMDANQGGIFILNDEDSENIVYELKAAYAYNRRKYLEKHIRPGEGLIGNSVIEKKTVYMTDLPENYINITSGLGEAPPRSLLIVPLKTEEEVLGVIEIASFNEIEKHQIEFVEKVAESIASTISSVRTNLRTSELLEKSQQQAEEMSAQEEEMRQNMEELQATQEESARREREFTNILDAIDNFLLKSEMDKKGNILSTNQLFNDLLKYSKDEFKGRSLSDFVDPEYSEKYQSLINEAQKGEHKQQMIKFTDKSGKSLWLLSSLDPMKDNDGNIYKILFIAVDLTDSEEEKRKLKDKKKN
ncbi:MAG: GAF domain-containing protein [Bacteroidales bacterium]